MQAPVIFSLELSSVLAFIFGCGGVVLWHLSPWWYVSDCVRAYGPFLFISEERVRYTVCEKDEDIMYNGMLVSHSVSCCAWWGFLLHLYECVSVCMCLLKPFKKSLTENVLGFDFLNDRLFQHLRCKAKFPFDPTLDTDVSRKGYCRFNSLWNSLFNLDLNNHFSLGLFCSSKWLLLSFSWDALFWVALSGLKLHLSNCCLLFWESFSISTADVLKYFCWFCLCNILALTGNCLLLWRQYSPERFLVRFYDFAATSKSQLRDCHIPVLH